MQIAELGHTGDVYLRLRPHFVPNWFELHPHHGVEVLELGIAHIQVLQVEILSDRKPSSFSSSVEIIHQRVVSFELHEECLHTLGDTVLALPHVFRHGLIHLHHLGLTGSKSDLYGFVVSSGSTGSAEERRNQRSTCRGQIMTLFMLRLTSMSFSGDIPWANISGSSENALQNPLYRLPRSAIPLEEARTD